jgi:hypothetical protein
MYPSCMHLISGEQVVRVGEEREQDESPLHVWNSLTCEAGPPQLSPGPWETH